MEVQSDIPIARLRPIVPAGWLFALSNFPVSPVGASNTGYLPFRVCLSIGLMLAATLTFADSLPLYCRRAGVAAWIGAWLIILLEVAHQLPLREVWWPGEAIVWAISVVCIGSLPWSWAKATGEHGAPKARRSWLWATGVTVGYSFLGLGFMLVARARGDFGNHFEVSNPVLESLGCIICFIPLGLVTRATMATGFAVASAGTDRCASCRYPLEGLRSNRCPECGGTSRDTSHPPLGAALAGVPWGRALALIAVLALITLIAALQRPTSPLRDRLPTTWLMRYADRLVPEGNRSGVARALFRRDTLGVPGPARSFSPDALAAQAELLRRMRDPALPKPERSEILAFVVKTVCGNPAESDPLREILGLASSNGELSAEQTRILLNSWLTCTIKCRSVAAPGEPLGIQIALSEQFRASVLHPALSSALPVMDLALVSAESVSIGGVPVARDAHLQAMIGSEPVVLFEMSDSQGLTIPAGVPQGDQRVDVRLRVRWFRERFGTSSPSLAELVARGVPESWEINASKTIRVVPKSAHPIERYMAPDAASLFMANVSVHIGPQFNLLTSPGGLVRNLPAHFVLDVYVPGHESEGSVGRLVFDSARVASPHLPCSPMFAGLCAIPKDQRRLILRPVPGELQRTSLEGAVYDGPDLLMPVKCQGD